jgi:hypothetical protein
MIIARSFEEVDAAMKRGEGIIIWKNNLPIGDPPSCVYGKDTAPDRSVNAYVRTHIEKLRIIGELGWKAESYTGELEYFRFFLPDLSIGEVETRLGELFIFP